MLVFQNVLWLLVLIGVMIIIHEAGHYWAARYFDVRIETFSFGFGPRLFGFRKGETDFRFSAILFGGYVKMTGEQPGDENADDPRSFLSKPRWQRLIIGFAGPFMNVVLAVGLLTGLFMVKYQKLAAGDERPIVGYVIKDSAAAKAGIQPGDKIVRFDNIQNPTWEDVNLKEIASAGRTFDVVVERNGQLIEKKISLVLDERNGIGFAGWAPRAEVQVGTLSSGMPAQKAGLQKGDLLLTANGQTIQSMYTLQDIIQSTNGKPVTIEYERNGKRSSVTVTPVFSKGDGPARWIIGFLPERRLNLITMRLSLPAAFSESVRQNVKGAELIFKFLAGIIERRMSPKSLEGPIRIAQLSGEAAREGPSSFFLLMSMVSLNLAIFNLLPIPILDGGVIVLLLIEMLIRRDLSLQVKETVFKLGFVFLMVVVAFVIYNDLSKILPAG
ncbi:MAG: RIP metalloprotease RseP [Acidobacteria bacterium]|nr:MAG: RIP metalloprotease RseP [Acidobacteriota bacterium]